MHTDLPAVSGATGGTKLRGYVQTNAQAGSPALSPHYLGPLIIAKGCVAAAGKTCVPTPVRIKFTNMLPTGAGGDLFIPTDTTYMGAGAGPDGTPYSENRATLHLHGGNTPWISDGTPHQWTVPAGETGTNYQEGRQRPQCPRHVV